MLQWLRRRQDARRPNGSRLAIRVSCVHLTQLHVVRFLQNGGTVMVSAIRAAGLLASVGVLMSAGPAHAICAYSEASYQGGAYGAYAVTSGCSIRLDQGGGALSTTASASTTISTPYVDASSSADLTLGALTAHSAAGSASSALWDTFTYSGLPVGGASVEATLSLPGTLTGYSHGSAELQEGTEADLEDGTAVSNFGIADLADPPTLSLTVPLGASVMSASGAGPVSKGNNSGENGFGHAVHHVERQRDRGRFGEAVEECVFDNFTASSAVPEPATWAMMLLGFVGLGFCQRRTGALFDVGALPPRRLARQRGRSLACFIALRPGSGPPSPNR